MGHRAFKLGSAAKTSGWPQWVNTDAGTSLGQGARLPTRAGGVPENKPRGRGGDGAVLEICESADGHV